VKVSEQLPEEIETYRDRMWQREPERRVETAGEAEKLIERAGFCAAMTDARRPGASLYVSVCGRRDAHMPRNVQKDPESSQTWLLKDEIMRRGRVYYAKLAKGRAMFVAPRLVPHLNALWGVARRDEGARLSADARAVLKILRREWEMASSDLRAAAEMGERVRLTRALDELQRTLKVIPGDVMYEPWFTYIWMLAEARFGAELKVRVKREVALRELAKVTGLSRPDAGLGNRALVAEGYAVRIGEGVYQLADLERRLGELNN
jgi:hypothetical protein